MSPVAPQVGISLAGSAGKPNAAACSEVNSADMSELAAAKELGEA